VAGELGNGVRGDMPGFAMNKDAAERMFEHDLKTLQNSGYIRTLVGHPFLAVHSPAGVQAAPLILPFAGFTAPKESFPWTSGTGFAHAVG